MVKQCAVYGCCNLQTYVCTLSFHRFPKKDETGRRDRWLTAINRRVSHFNFKKWEPSNNARVCGVHFVSGLLAEV